jgi:hypothetical protein
MSDAPAAALGAVDRASQARRDLLEGAFHAAIFWRVP